MVRRCCVAMAVFSRRFVWCADTEQLCARRFGFPFSTKVSIFVGTDSDIIANKVTEDPVGIYSESIFTGYDTGNGDFAFLIDLAPVLL